MKEKTISCEEKLTKLNAPQIPEKRDDKEDVKGIKGNPHQQTKVRRRVKLPCLKLEDLVSQITEENAHKEISTGPAVGNEIW